MVSKMSIVRRIQSWWARRQRAVDRQILWPMCCDLASTKDEAIRAFLWHASRDPAWHGWMEPEDIIDEVCSWPWGADGQ